MFVSLRLPRNWPGQLRLVRAVEGSAGARDFAGLVTLPRIERQIDQNRRRDRALATASASPTSPLSRSSPEPSARLDPGEHARQSGLARRAAALEIRAQ